MSAEAEGRGGASGAGEGRGEAAGTEGVAGQDRVTCTPCRGTGRVQSALGGESHEVTCPWCGGSGRFIPGRDAQEEPAEQGGQTASDGEMAGPQGD